MFSKPDITHMSVVCYADQDHRSHGVKWAVRKLSANDAMATEQKETLELHEVFSRILWIMQSLIE